MAGRTGGAQIQGHVAWALAGNVGYSLCQWGILVCLAKLGTATDVGRFALGLALTAPIITFTNLHLRIIEATDAREDFSFSTYWTVRLVATVTGLAVIGVLAFVCGYRGAVWWLIIAVGIAKAFEALSDVIFGLLQKADRFRRIALSMLAKGVASILALGLVLAATGSLVAATLAMALVWGGLLATIDLPAARQLASVRVKLDPAVGALARLALPMGFVAALSSVTANIPRYAIEGNLGAAALGHFAALAYLFAAGSQPMLALAAVLNPRLARHYATNVSAFHRLTLGASLLVATIGALGVLAALTVGPWILRTAYAPEYAAEAPALVWLAVAAGISFVSSIVGYAITAARRLPQQLPIAVASVLVCAAASHLLVPRFGLLGAAWAVLLTEATRLALLGGVYWTVWSNTPAVGAPTVTPRGANSSDLPLECVP